jgi:hypothetical protein
MPKKWLFVVTLASIVAVWGSILPAGAASTPKVVAAGKIRRGDLPSGWKLKPRDDDDKSSDTDAIVKTIPTCASVKKLVKDESDKKTESREFKRGHDEISNSINAYRRVAAAKAVMGITRSPDLRTCFGELFEAELKKAAAADPSSPVRINGVNTTSAPITVPEYGDDSSGVTFKVDLDMGLPTPVQLYFSLEFVRVGRFVSAYSLEREQPGTNLPALDQAIRTTVDRMNAAGA